MVRIKQTVTQRKITSVPNPSTKSPGSVSGYESTGSFGSPDSPSENLRGRKVPSVVRVRVKQLRSPSSSSGSASGYGSNASFRSQDSPSRNLRPRPTKAPERYQPAIPKNTFARVIRSIAEEMMGQRIRFSDEAERMIKEEAEAMIIRLFDAMGHSAFINGRKTVTMKDFAVAMYKPTGESKE